MIGGMFWLGSAVDTQVYQNIPHQVEMVPLDASIGATATQPTQGNLKNNPNYVPSYINTIFYDLRFPSTPSLKAQKQWAELRVKQFENLEKFTSEALKCFDSGATGQDLRNCVEGCREKLKPAAIRN